MSSARVSRSFPLPASILELVDEDSSMEMELQGIVTILGSDLQQNKVGSSLRRTLSADMSSKKWLEQNGVISPLKRIASFEQLSIIPPGAAKDELEKQKLPINNDSWSSIILAKKNNDDTDNVLPPPPPYIHPLVKKPSTLSEKSLEICTESLGSETGSDCFSSYPHSETSDVEEPDKEEEEEDAQQVEPHIEELPLPVAKYNYNPCKKLLPKAFPPPLPSIARGDGLSLQMQSHRKNGRLVLEAVTVPPVNYFHAERQEGRLLLSLVNDPTSQEEEMEEKVEEFGEVFDTFEQLVKMEEEDEEEEEESEEEEEELLLMEQSSSLPCYNMNRSGVMMKRLMRLDNNDTTWSKKLNKEVHEMVEGLTLFPQSLPPPPPPIVARFIPAQSSPSPAASSNVYEYFWRKNPTVASKVDPSIDNNVDLCKNNTAVKAYEQKDLVVMRGNTPGHLVPLSRGGCKETRQSLFIWEPRYISTT